MNSNGKLAANNKTKLQGLTVSIPYKHIFIGAYLYMVIPITIFLTTWLKWFVGVPLAIILLFSLYHLVKHEYKTITCSLHISVKCFIAVLSIIAIFLWMTGQGGFFFQYSDNHWRNAVLHDLVYFDWPVIYETNNALVYYLLHWLIPALIGKLTSSFLIARIALYFWTFLGVNLVIFLLSVVLKANSNKKIFLILLVFISWGGINIIGGILSNIFGLIDFDLNTFGWWTNFSFDGQGYAYMYRSNCDQLSSVYNQTIAPWLAVPLLVHHPKSSTFVFLAACVFAYAPLPFIGIAALMFFYFMRSLVQEKTHQGRKQCLKAPFSLHNIGAFISVVPVFLLYFICNIAVTSGAGGKPFSLYIPLDKFSIISAIILVAFYILQFGVFAILIYKDYKHDSLFKFMIVSLCLIPLFKLGTMADFCWNVSVPMYFLLMMYCIKYIHNNVTVKKENNRLEISKSIIGLSICIALAFINPMAQIAFGFKIAYQEKTFDLMCRGYIDTFSDKTQFEYSENFLVPTPEDTVFFRYLAK